MNRSRFLLSTALAMLIIGCSSIPRTNQISLQCGTPYKDGGFVGVYSFQAGDISECLANPEACSDPSACASPDQLADLRYYFDNNDCSKGALFGRGYMDIFPINKKLWGEVERLNPPSGNSRPVAAIGPLTKDREGMAFWVKAADGNYAWVRIKSIQPVTYADLAAGMKPVIKLEWGCPEGQKKK